MRWAAALRMLAACGILAACATTRAMGPVKPREATEPERLAIGRAVLPLLVVAGIWRGPQDGCAVALAVRPVEPINLGVAPSKACKLSLVVTEGALRVLPDDELQAAVAHELGHVQFGHFEARGQRRQQERARQKEIESGSTGTAIVAAIPVIGPLIAVGIAGTQTTAEAARFRAYDRGEEEEADRFAAELLKRLPGGDERCQALVRLFDRLERERSSPRWGDWQSTHPAPARRAEAIRRECAA
jgi:Zn-dependent protease with chaperone function